MSKLAKRLRQVSEGLTPTMGFKAAAAKPSRQIALVASLSSAGIGVMSELKLAEVDAVLLPAEDLVDVASLKKVASGLRDVPWGVWVEEANTDWLVEFRGVGGDFLAFDSPDAPATLLQEDGVGKVLKVELSFERSLLGTIGDLPIDAVVLDVKKGNELAISDIMACQWLSKLTEKPVLVVPGGELSETETRSLWEVGVMGIVIEVLGRQSLDVLTRQSQAIRGLPAKPRKRKEGGALLPHPSPGAGDIDTD
jgi:hypothetical protein